MQMIIVAGRRLLILFDPLHISKDHPSASRSITTLGEIISNANQIIETDFLPIPRPGYTSGILSSRPVSLPRGVNGNANAPTGWSSSLSPAQRKIYSSNTSRPLPINGGPAPLNGSRDGAFSCFRRKRAPELAKFTIIGCGDSSAFGIIKPFFTFRTQSMEKIALVNNAEVLCTVPSDLLPSPP
ncbi:hypothetical protein ACTXT7_004769 [Hymenolepis weldensis]